MSDVEINCQNYSNFKAIGCGFRSQVFKAKHKKTGEYVAIKEINLFMYYKPVDLLKKEIEILKKTRNENSVEIKEIIETKEFFYIIMEYCEYNLESYLKKKLEIPFSICEIRDILIQMNNTLKLTIKEKIIYRCIKLNNILISFNKKNKMSIKLSDYCCLTDIYSSNIIGRNFYTISPEIFSDGDNFSKVDLWSIGIIIYYLYFEEYPYNGRTGFSLYNDMASGKQLKLIYNEDLNDLMNRLLKINIEERLSWEEYFNHPFFKNEYYYSKEEMIKEIKKLEEIIKTKDKMINCLENELKNKENIIENGNENIKDIFNHSDSVNCLTLLNNYKFASGSSDKSIIIYNKENYQPDIIIKQHSGSVEYLTQLKSGILASCSADKTIQLFKILDSEYEIIQNLNFHTDTVYKIIELSNNSLVSCSADSTIIFYIKDNLKYKKDYTISASSWVRNIIQTKKNEIAYSISNKRINFYDFNEKKNKSVIHNISFSGWSLCMITNDLLLIPGLNIISIINVNEYKIIRQIDIPNSGWINGVSILNSNMLLTGDDNGTLIQWRIEENNINLISKKEKAHDWSIYVILSLEDGHIATGSSDNTIKIW